MSGTTPISIEKTVQCPNCRSICKVSCFIIPPTAEYYVGRVAKCTNCGAEVYAKKSYDCDTISCEVSVGRLSDWLIKYGRWVTLGVGLAGAGITYLIMRKKK